ncbi:GGDEF domain-containing protein [Fodinicurvata halophila]|uniref:diguanylate cyclase n=1 Tax=Fodinicurvata halophila TaxID=1419723 RepID=A0ABV8UQN0_9PROT
MVFRTLAIYDDPDLNSTLLSRLGELGHQDRRTAQDSRAAENEDSLMERLRIRLADQKRQIAAQAERIRVLESLAVTDELTGLLNRRGFRQSLERALAEAGRHNDMGILVLCDLDSFKQVNDRHGHIAGDVVLRHVGHLLEQYTRRNDSVCRIGGDEFAVLMPRTPPVLAASLTEKLENLVNRQSVDWNGESIRVSGSFGYETFDGSTDPTTLFSQADQLLYERKRRQPVAELLRQGLG